MYDMKWQGCISNSFTFEVAIIIALICINLSLNAIFLYISLNVLFLWQ